MGHGEYPVVVEGARRALRAGDVGRDAGSEGVVDVGGEGGGHHFVGAIEGEVEVGVGGWHDGVAVTAAVGRRC